MWWWKRAFIVSVAWTFFVWIGTNIHSYDIPPFGTISSIERDASDLSWMWGLAFWFGQAAIWTAFGINHPPQPKKAGG